MIVAASLAFVGTLKAIGWLNLDWVSVEAHITQAVHWLHGEAEGLKNLVTGFLPSAGAAGAGSFFGFRKK